VARLCARGASLVCAGVRAFVRMCLWGSVSASLCMRACMPLGLRNDRPSRTEGAHCLCVIRWWHCGLTSTCVALSHPSNLQATVRQGVHAVPLVGTITPQITLLSGECSTPTPSTATPSTATPSTATPSTATPTTATPSTATPTTAAPRYAISRICAGTHSQLRRHGPASLAGLASVCAATPCISAVTGSLLRFRPCASLVVNLRTARCRDSGMAGRAWHAACWVPGPG
jgi:hypothetical protein